LRNPETGEELEAYSSCYNCWSSPFAWSYPASPYVGDGAGERRQKYSELACLTVLVVTSLPAAVLCLLLRQPVVSCSQPPPASSAVLGVQRTSYGEW